ncbi:ABC transporter substrate-binding protein [Microvirga sp. W0021]|uniref:ABC transporter substrate-binding protein n=1 Tax=Hohaiivirga grylli TaxID=3133970 RepID=A0ABV0BG93_9HYPH
MRTYAQIISTVLATLSALLVCGALHAAEHLPYREVPFFQAKVADHALLPVEQRMPKEPLVVDLNAKGRLFGIPGGDIVTIVARARDIRYQSAIGYTRLVGLDENFDLYPDILQSVDNQNDRVFTFHIRPGHRWSDGSFFTAEDFRFYWEDIANNSSISPVGPPEFMLIDGRGPRFEVIDQYTVRYTWDKPNPRFLPQLASPRDPFIYRPAHYLKQFHASYTDQKLLDVVARQQKLKSWAGLFNRMDTMYDLSDPDMPTLQPWKPVTYAPANRYYFERNPYYHRVDYKGVQLPYVDRLIFDISAPGLMAAKANAGEVDLLFRGLTMRDIPVLKEGEKVKDYRTRLWRVARGSELALYPNLNCSDPVFRKLNRDVRFRRALSLGIKRKTINMVLLYGLGREGNNTVISKSPLYRDEFRYRNSSYDPDEANRLLDELGLKRSDSTGLRILPDGRPLIITVELDGDQLLMADGLALIGEFWQDLGIKLIVKPQDRAILNNRSYSGQTIMSASVGLDNAIPNALTPPTELVPMHQDNLAWPKWGQYIETKGNSGEPIDIPEARELAQLYEQWMAAEDTPSRQAIWLKILENHADNLWSIGTVAGSLHPIVVKNNLANVPEKAFYSWAPTSFIGVYRMDEFFWATAERRQGGNR